MLRHIPNTLCVLRMLLAVPVALLLVRKEYCATLIVFGIAAVTDGLDGFLAKRFHWTSELGKALDPLADKILLVTAFVTLAIVGPVPVWLTVTVVVRDLVITIGAIVYVNVFGPLTEAKPTLISKVNTLMQITYILVVVAAPALTVNWQPATTVLTVIVLVTTLLSGIDYTATYIQRAMAVSRVRR